jgi:ABC-2 type transport system ATP-binding protein
VAVGAKGVIEVDDFHKAYDDTVAVSGLSFVVRPGQILGLVGPNGAGKTTTLRALTGIIPASRGRLAICGHDIDNQPRAAKRCLGYIPDDPQLFPNLTINEHLAFFAAAYQVDGASGRADRLLHYFELDTKWNTTARELSRGMRQKLAICCAYLHDPRAILFDEPLTGLDPHGIRTLKQSIVDRAANHAAIVVSSHLLAMVEDICTHVLILERGRQVSWGPVGQLRSQFAHCADETSLEDIYFRVTDAPWQETSVLPTPPPVDAAPAGRVTTSTATEEVVEVDRGASIQ